MAPPSISVIARLLLKEMKKDQKTYNRILKSILKDTEDAASGVEKATKRMDKTFQDFVDSVLKNEARTEKATTRFVSSLDELSKAFDELKGKEFVNVEKFIENLNAGQSSMEAFKGATEGGARSLGSLAGSLATVATTVAGVTAVLKTAKRALDENIQLYKDLGDETRRIILLTGMSAEEASSWAIAAEIQGVSARSLAAGFNNVSRKLAAMQLKMAEGKEDTSKFAKAINAFNIDLRKTDGTFKDTAQLTTEINAKIRELGLGWQAAAVASFVYGRGSQAILPLIQDQALSLEEVTRMVMEQNAAMTDLDQEGLDAVRKAEAKLLIARKAQAAVLGKEYLPLQAKLINAHASLVGFMTKVDIQVRSITAGLREQFPVLFDVVGFMTGYNEELDKLAGNTEAAAETQDKLTEAQQTAIDTLFGEEDAAGDLNDTLKEQQGIVRDLTDAWGDYLDRQVDINRRFDDQLGDVDIRSGRERAARILKQGFALEDIHIKRNQRLRELEFKWQNKIADIQIDIERKIEDFQKNAARAREKIAVKHRENLLKIENRFNDTVEEAARTNDTVAVVRAIRQRSREQRDETRRSTVEQQELEKDLKLKRDKIDEDAKRQRDDQINRDAERRAAIERQFKDEIDALGRKNTRELALSKEKDRERREDIERNRAQALRDAGIFYERERLALQTHLRELNVIAVLTTMGTTQEIARVAADAMASVAAITAGGVTGAATRAATEFIGGGLSRPPTGETIDQWLRGRTTGGYRARGGLDVVNRPTTFTAGEAGAEIAAFIPLSNNRSMNHTFDKLPIDFGGLPGGMDTGQIETIVYSAMIELARVLGSTRR